ncbi:hypothetical protein GCM10020000_05770 [Streptomyces olivoverticillatus]
MTATDHKGKGVGRRLIGLLRPHRALVAVLVALGIGGIAINAYGPILLGRATDMIFAGVVG